MIVPFIVLFALLVAGIWLEELSVRGALGFLGVLIASYVGVAVLGIPGYYIVAITVILDLVLILKIFRGGI